MDTRKGHAHSQDRRTIESGHISWDSLSDGCPDIAGVFDPGNAPRIGLFSVHCDLVPHRQAAAGFYRIKRILEVCREWDRSVHIVQIDLSKAFDRVLYRSVLQTLRLQFASLQCIAVGAAVLSQCELAVRLGHVITDQIKLHRGFPQGAPESPVFFILVCEVVLRPQMANRRKRLVLLRVLAYVSRICELIDAFAGVGLDISVDTCAWSSYPPEKQGTLAVRGFELNWVKSMTAVGTVINFSGIDGEAILHRLAQAAKSRGAWTQFLRSPRDAQTKRLKLLISTVFASALWLPLRFATVDGAQFWRSAAPKRSPPTPCQHGYHVKRQPSVEAAHFCRTFSKIERSRPVADAQDSLSFLFRREQAQYHSK